MGAYQREKSRSFGPDSLRAMGRVFDELWAEMAGDIGDNPDVVEAARLALAEAVLAVASDESRDVDVEALKTAVLRVTVLRGRATPFRVRPTAALARRSKPCPQHA